MKLCAGLLFVAASGLLRSPAAASVASYSSEFNLQSQRPTGSIVTAVEKNDCKIVQLLQGIRSRTECAIKCQIAKCSAATYRDGVCRLARIETADSSPVQPGCDTANAFNVSSDEELLIPPQALLNPVNVTFRNTSTGCNGTIQTMTVNQTGCYRMEAFGARGGSTNPAYSPVYTGGFGASIGGSFNLTAGTQIRIVIGQRGGNANQAFNHAASGGGGGTFVYRSSDNLLYLAAGGGGGGSIGYYGLSGSAGVSGTGTVGTASYVGYGGANGQPGSYGPSTSTYKGGLGAGWLGAAANRTSTCYGERGGSLSQGWVGGVAGHNNEGAVGGFGGGGGGSHESGAAGGGGGFSGGGAGSWFPQAGGGGGSFCSGLNCSALSGGNSFSDSGLLLVQLISAGSCA